MVREGIVLGHLVSSKGLEVDKAKVKVIQDLALPQSIRELRSFMQGKRFYHIGRREGRLYAAEAIISGSGGVRPPSPPRHDTTAPVEPTPTRVQPPRQAKTKDPEFHYTK